MRVFRCVGPVGFVFVAVFVAVVVFDTGCIYYQVFYIYKDLTAEVYFFQFFKYNHPFHSREILSPSRTGFTVSVRRFINITLLTVVPATL